MENRYVLRCFLNVSSDGHSRRLHGKLFQFLEAEVLNDFSPTDNTFLGMVKRVFFTESFYILTEILYSLNGHAAQML